MGPADSAKLICNISHIMYTNVCIYKVCKKQYKSRLRWNNYRESDRKFLMGKDIKQKSLDEHFLRDGHQSL